MSPRLRSYLGYPPVRDAQPNTSHFALAALQYTSHLSHIITQVTFTAEYLPLRMLNLISRTLTAFIIKQYGTQREYNGLLTVSTRVS